jgi:hypothetical protein
MNIDWICFKPVSVENIKECEEFFAVPFPDIYKETVLNFNGGHPQPYCFDLGGEKGKVFDRLLSVSRENKWNIYAAAEILRETSENLIPFGSDPFGNDLCFDYSKTDSDPAVVFHDHERAYEDENYHGEFICSGFAEFLYMLYSDEET